MMCVYAGTQCRSSFCNNQASLGFNIVIYRVNGTGAICNEVASGCCNL